jgi:hypothetical protein
MLHPKLKVVQIQIWMTVPAVFGYDKNLDASKPDPNMKKVILDASGHSDKWVSAKTHVDAPGYF